MTSFNENETREYYNKEDSLYQSLWSKEGNLHWGYFSEPDSTLDEAMIELNKKMLNMSEISDSSKVLDLGCGNGNNSIYIYDNTQAEVVGLDLSDVRITNAQNKIQGSQQNISFLQGSAIKLPFKDSSFSHVFSQSTLYHVHNKKKALQEIHRVLKDDGLFIFEDLVKPKPEISDEAKQHIYDRLLFDTDFSIEGYIKQLEDIGFSIEYVEDMSQHFAKTYSVLSEKIKSKLDNNIDVEFHERYEKLYDSYVKTPKLVENGEIGWILIKARKK